MENKIHHGRNIKRFREMFGIKQEALAVELGDDWSQKKISLLEQKEEIEPALLQNVARILKVPVEAIEKFDENAAISVIANTFTSNDTSTLNAINHHCTFNPIDKWAEEITENRKLYERLLLAEREKIDLLQKILDKYGA
ncbi:MAG: XRE family transcriptional regulator [Sphingobacteriales bacterium]|nr:MAG: XRE family transcriptional regulator [Sphingobacteriales bacterium]